MSLDVLVAALAEREAPSRTTSIRQPQSLRRALKAAVGLGFAATPNEGMNQALRAQLDAFAQRQALDAIYATDPSSRPSLAAVALELARLDHDDLADDPDLIAQAAGEVLVYRPDADADDVLLWAASLRAHLRKAEE